MFPKTKRTKLRGTAVKELNNTIHKRDNNQCVICKKHVDPGEKWHHVFFGNGRKNDVEEEGVLLCYECHQKIHSNGEVMKENTRKCVEYLRSIYGDLEKYKGR